MIRRLFPFRKKEEPPDELPGGLAFTPRQRSYDQVHEQWERLQHRLGQTGPAVRPGWRPAVLRAAAVLTGVTLLGLLGWWYHQTRSFTRLAAGYGQIARVTLPDGSEAVLNGNSSLRYRKSWRPGQVREAWLEGEAFFHVRKQPAPTRFLVHTGGLQVEVLGTEFNVSTRRGHTEVVLHAGAVKLVAGTPGKTVYMQPRELVRYSEKRAEFRKKTVRTEPYLAWQQGKMVFDDTPVQQVARMLQDTYGLTVRVSDPALADRKVTGEIQTRDVDVLLAALATLLDADVQRNGNQVTIAPF